ncbi:Cytoplasmic dynein 1 light intermediate chain 2 [Fasciola hepatica]|uniref:Dynein light intermediate chain n=1 Tax=Fasciola hepatica TaxID=6192 RepID=A0A4E0R5N7_FASHE|nr:Cytoplasmic dynein 1 light intermediate chain 2 [Fasciola hepatica]
MPAFELDAVGSQDDLSHDDGKRLWSSLLKEVTHKASVKLPSTRALIVLGDDGCGKTSLITRLQRTEDPKTSYGLEYTFIDIKDEDRDDQTKLNVWILDGDVVHSHLLKFALNAKNFGECVAVIMVSMAEPWNIVESLEKWADILSRHIKRLSIPPETLTDYKNGLVQQFREYVEPDSLLTPTTPAPITHAPLPTAPTAARRVTQSLHPATAALLSSTLAAQSTNTDSTQRVSQPDADGDEMDEVDAILNRPMLLPLDATTLSENLGIPLVVVVTKTDAMKTLEKEDRFTEEHFDFIQMHIRRFCLTYGAALFYVSVKEDRNCDLLNRYLQSRIYGFPFTQSAYVVERECVFVEKKISILEENFTQIRSTDAYNDVIPRPPPRKPAVREPELMAQDEQSFLTRLIAIMQREPNQPSAQSGSGTTGSAANSSEAILEQLASAAALTSASGGAAQPGGARGSIGSPRTPQSGVRAKPSPSSVGSGGIAGPGSGAGNRTSEGVLANFFTSLLNKRSAVANAPTGPGATSAASAAAANDKLAMSPKDLQTELERLARSSREQLEASKQVKQPTPETSDGDNATPATNTAAAEVVAAVPDATKQARPVSQKKTVPVSAASRSSPVKQSTPGNAKNPALAKTPEAKGSPKTSKPPSPAKQASPAPAGTEQQQEAPPSS